MFEKSTSNAEKIGESQERPGAYAWYVLAILTVVLVVSYIDRQILAILAEPIKQDLGFSDTQLGFLTGFAFAIVYSTFGVVIARFADKHNRISIVSIAIAFWSIMTALCGLASTFIQMMLARMGVALGEAGTVPPAHSLIADFFNENRRGLALAIYTMGSTIGAGLGYLIGGWINDAMGWRQAFWVVGIPGVLLAVFVRTTLRDPRRVKTTAIRQESLRMLPRELWQALRILWNLPSYRYAVIGFAIYGYATWGLATWHGVYLIRVHELSSAEAGSYLFAAAMVGGCIGILICGFATDRLTQRDPRYFLWIPSCALIAITPISLVMYLSDDTSLVGRLLFSWEFCSVFAGPPIFAAVLSIVPDSVRTTAVAINLLLLNFIGMGFGPQTVGILSDLYSSWAGEGSVRFALGTIAIGQLIAAVVFFVGAKTFRAKQDD